MAPQPLAHSLATLLLPEKRARIDCSVLRYLEDRVGAVPWAVHLHIVAFVMSQEGLRAGTVMNTVQTLHMRFRTLFDALQIQSMAEWVPWEHIPAYLAGELVLEHSAATRLAFWHSYSSAARHCTNWFQSLPPEEQEYLSPFILLRIRLPQALRLIRESKLRCQCTQARTGALDPTAYHLLELREAAHQRYQMLSNLHEVYLRTLQERRQCSSSFPIEFCLYANDKRTSEQAQPGLYHCRVWDRRSFVLLHAENYSGTTVAQALSYQNAFETDKSIPLLEILDQEHSIASSTGSLWFSELLRNDLLGKHATWGARAVLASKQAWLQAHGYIQQGVDRLAPFDTDISELLGWPSSYQITHFIAKAQQVAEGVFVPLESLYHAATIGLLALDLCTTTGLQVSELLRLRLSPEHLIRIQLNNSTKRQAKQRYWYALHLPAHRTQHSGERLHLLRSETVRLLARLQNIYMAVYGLESGVPLPHVTNARRSHKQPLIEAAAYLFQYQNVSLSDKAIRACMRFLLHGLTTSLSGQPVVFSDQLLQRLDQAPPIQSVSMERASHWLMGGITRTVGQADLLTTYDVDKPEDRLLALYARSVDICDIAHVLPAQHYAA